MVEILIDGKLAKWAVMTAVQSCYNPRKEVFVKPTNAKNAISVFELEGLTYRPQPTWDFYNESRKQVLIMRDMVDSSLAPSNPAFTAFLMLSMEKWAA
jgi:hypothetical protein